MIGNQTRGVIMLQKMCIERALERLPMVDQKIRTLASGFAQWGVIVEEIQSLGWPWVIVPIRYSEDAAKMLYLWNISQKKKNGGTGSWAIFPAGDKFILLHPMSWSSDYAIIEAGTEFGRFLSSLPADALTPKGFLEAQRKLKAQAARGVVGIGEIQLQAI
jgi:hypothetical protein